MKVQANVALTYDGRRYRVGDVFDAEPRYARPLILTGVAVEVDDEAELAGGKRYRRRDMRAEQ